MAGEGRTPYAAGENGGRARGGPHGGDELPIGDEPLAMARGTARRIVPRVGVLKETSTTPDGADRRRRPADVAVDAVGDVRMAEGDIRDHRTDHPHGEHAVASTHPVEPLNRASTNTRACARASARRGIPMPAASTDGSACRSTRCRGPHADRASALRAGPEMIAEPTRHRCAARLSR